jgi:hydroxymethylpyrimidine pyrophosphatase-like HAD family hydrolase
MTLSQPPLALLLDVDGPLASPVTRRVSPGIITSLIELVRQGIPVVFNTGRSDAFITEQLMEPMLAAGLPAGSVVHAICEKGAVWFSFTPDGPGPIHVDKSLIMPAAYGNAIRDLVASSYSEHMFFDETKRAMVSVEQHVEVESSAYLEEQAKFDADALALLATHDLGAVRLDHRAPASAGTIDYRVDPSIISTDIESVRLGKDLGASRAVELLAAQGIVPQAWRTLGDSRTDYAMADWLHHQDHAVKHVDVRPADGVPVKPYPVKTASDLALGDEVVNDFAGAAFLQFWLDGLAR